MKHLTYLLIGIGITIIFLVMCFTDFNIYERLYFNQGYNDKLFSLDMYPVFGLILIVVAWGVAALYYYGINSVKFDRWYHWLCMLAIVTVAVPVVCYIYNNAIFGENNLQYTQESIVFELQNLLFAPIMFIIASFSMRWWSSNCRHTPIPQ